MPLSAGVVTVSATIQPELVLLIVTVAFGAINTPNIPDSILTVFAFGMLKMMVDA